MQGETGPTINPMEGKRVESTSRREALEHAPPMEALVYEEPVQMDNLEGLERNRSEMKELIFME